MIRSTSPLNRSASTESSVLAAPPRLPDQPERSCPGAGSCRVQLRAQELRQPLEIQDPADQQRLLADAQQSAPTEAAQSVPVLAFAEELLDQPPAPLRHLVAAAPLPHAHSRMSLGTPTGLGRNMWLDAAREQGLKEGFMEESFVGAERGGGKAQASFRPVQQAQAPDLL